MTAPHGERIRLRLSLLAAGRMWEQQNPQAGGVPSAYL
jgi:hypothetical protein